MTVRNQVEVTETQTTVEIQEVTTYVTPEPIVTTVEIEGENTTVVIEDLTLTSVEVVEEVTVVVPVVVETTVEIITQAPVTAPQWLNDLNDVDTSGVSDGDTLIYRSGMWVIHPGATTWDGNPNNKLTGVWMQHCHDTRNDKVYICISDPTGDQWRVLY